MRPLTRMKFDRGVLIPVGYAAFFLACFLFFAVVSFPYDRLERFLEQQIARSWQPATPGAPPPRFSIDAIGPSWTLGVAFEGVHLVEDAPQPGRMPIAIALDELTIRPSLFSLALGRTRVTFDAAVGDGSIDGSVAISGTDTTVEADLDDVDLAKLGFGGLLGIPVAGSASGHIELATANDPAQDEGSVNLQVVGMVLGDGKTKAILPGMTQGLTVEPIKAGNLDLKVMIHQGVAAVETIEARGDDLELDASGSLRLGRPLARSRVDLTFEWKFEDAYRERNDRTRALFQLMGAQPMVARATGADGKTRFAVSGTPQALRTRPAGAAAASRLPTRRAARAQPAE